MTDAEFLKRFKRAKEVRIMYGYGPSPMTRLRLFGTRDDISIAFVDRKHDNAIALLAKCLKETIR